LVSPGRIDLIEQENSYMETRLVVSNPANLARIPELLQQGGITFRQRTMAWLLKDAAGEETSRDVQFYWCQRDQAEATIGVIHADVSEELGEPIESGSFLLHIFPKPGFFRWLFHGSPDRALVKEIARRLRPLQKSNRPAPPCPLPAQQAPATAEPRWYLAQGKNKYGPFRLAELRRLADAGTLRPETMLLQEGHSSWVPARTLAVLSFSPAPPP
jgi:hypothetical protein